MPPRQGETGRRPKRRDSCSYSSISESSSSDSSEDDDDVSYSPSAPRGLPKDQHGAPERKRFLKKPSRITTSESESKSRTKLQKEPAEVKEATASRRARKPNALPAQKERGKVNTNPPRAARSASASTSESSESVYLGDDRRSRLKGGYRNHDNDSPLIRVASCESISPRATGDRMSRSSQSRNADRYAKNRGKGDNNSGCPLVGPWAKQGEQSRAMGAGDMRGSRTLNSSHDGRGASSSRRLEPPGFKPLGRAKLEPMQFKPLKCMTMDEFGRYQADKKLKERFARVARVGRSKGRVDCHLDPRVMDQRYRKHLSEKKRMVEKNKIARDNLKLLEALQEPKSQYARQDHISDFKKNYVAMVKCGRHPEAWEAPKGVRAVQVLSRVRPRDADVNNMEDSQARLRGRRH